MPTPSQVQVISDYVSLTSDHLITVILLGHLFGSSQAFQHSGLSAPAVVHVETHTSGLLHFNQVIRARFARTSVKHAKKKKKGEKKSLHLPAMGICMLFSALCRLIGVMNALHLHDVRSCLMLMVMMMMMMAVGNVFVMRILGRKVAKYCIKIIK